VRDDDGVTLGAAVLSFAVVATALTVTPGLDTALVLRAALAQGRRDFLPAGSDPLALAR
jgi:threonine/homoserine/homoserine lactone efflux protein